MLDLIRRGTISLDDVGQLILDEADMLLGVSFEKQTSTILKSVTPPSGRQPKVLAMTATGSAEYLDALEAAFGTPFEPIVVEVPTRAVEIASASPASGPPASIEVLHARSDTAIREAIVAMCARATSAMVFVPRRADVADVLSDLRDHGIEASGFTGRSSTSVRTAAMESLRSGAVSALVSTDVTARGIDVADLSLVVHVGLPHSSEDLTHRSGRTGRGHRPPGLVVAVIAPDEDSRLREFTESAGMRVHHARNVRELAERLGPSDVSKRVFKSSVDSARGSKPPRPNASTRGRRGGDWARDERNGHRGRPRGGPRGTSRGGGPRRGR